MIFFITTAVKIYIIPPVVHALARGASRQAAFQRKHFFIFRGSENVLIRRNLEIDYFLHHNIFRVNYAYNDLKMSLSSVKENTKKRRMKPLRW
jgi:hypothetical protein